MYTLDIWYTPTGVKAVVARGQHEVMRHNYGTIAEAIAAAHRVFGVTLEPCVWGLEG